MDAKIAMNVKRGQVPYEDDRGRVRFRFEMEGPAPSGPITRPRGRDGARPSFQIRVFVLRDLGGFARGMMLPLLRLRLRRAV